MYATSLDQRLCKQRPGKNTAGVRYNFEIHQITFLRVHYVYACDTVQNS